MKVTVTNHALVRWLERACGQDMEAFRAKLAALAQPAADLRVKHAEIGGVWFVFDGPVLITVLEEKPTRIQTERHDRGRVNQAGHFGDPPPWQAKKRRRDHR